jgi:hypothetical protein
MALPGGPKPKRSVYFERRLGSAISVSATALSPDRYPENVSITCVVRLRLLGRRYDISGLQALDESTAISLGRIDLSAK